MVWLSDISLLKLRMVDNYFVQAISLRIDQDTKEISWPVSEEGQAEKPYHSTVVSSTPISYHLLHAEP